ncbi:MAG: tetratricopeptide repeat protein, partial [Calditrichia bacterium]
CYILNMEINNFGIHDKVEVDGRELHIHTGTLIQKKKIVTEVFEKGAFLTSREHTFDLRGESRPVNYEFLNMVIQEFHNSVIDEIEVLYRINEKLNQFKHPLSHFQLGTLFLKRSLFKEATRQYRKAVSLDPGFIRAHIGLGVSYLKSLRHEKALACFKQAIKLGDNYPDLLNYAGLACLFLNRFEKATAYFKKAIEINPDFSECQFNLGVALYKSALKSAKNPKVVAVPARVILYLKHARNLGRYQEAHWQSHIDNLLDALNMKDHQQTVKMLEEFQLRLIDFSSAKDKIYEFFLRFLFGGNELTPETIKTYERFFRGNNGTLKGYPDYWNNLGIFNLINSRSLFLRALSEFEKALEFAPNFKEARKNRDLIKSNENGFLILLRAILK